MSGNAYKKSVEDYIDRSNEVLGHLREQAGDLSDLIVKLVETRKNDGTIYIMGNGGSASTASHMVSDLQKTAIREGERRFRAFALNDNIPVMLAWANDVSYDAVFEEQLKNVLTPEDMVIGISGSGNSKNVLNAIDYANDTGAFTFGITGRDGGILAEKAQKSLVVKDDLMYRLEDIHLMINHIVVYALLKG